MIPESFEVIHGNCLDVLKTIPDNSFHATITDPPYGLKLDGWDNDVPTSQFWKEMLRVTISGGYLLAFGSPRLYHRLGSAIEDSGWDIRDCISWWHFNGFPKSRKHLKPAQELIVMARKPGEVHHDLNIDACRIAAGDDYHDMQLTQWIDHSWLNIKKEVRQFHPSEGGRYPANVVIDERVAIELGDYAKYFYCPKPTKNEKSAGLTTDNPHMTVKPIRLMQWLCRLVTPANGIILDPFCGSGTTGCAARLEDFRFCGIDQSEEYVNIARQRIAHWESEANG